MYIAGEGVFVEERESVSIRNDPGQTGLKCGFISSSTEEYLGPFSTKPIRHATLQA